MNPGFMLLQGEGKPHSTQRMTGSQPCNDLQVRTRRAPCPGRGPWLELSTGKRNMLGNVLSAPHRALQCKLSQDSSCAQQFCAPSWARGPDRIACIADGCAASKAARSASRTADHSPLTAPALVGPLGRSDSAHCDFVIGPAHSTHCPSLLCADLRRGTACRAPG
jgi:hypothetical protein